MVDLTVIEGGGERAKRREAKASNRILDGLRDILAGNVEVVVPRVTDREAQLAALLHGVSILAPRLRSPDAGTRMAANLMLDSYLHHARRLGVGRPNPPDAA